MTIDICISQVEYSNDVNGTIVHVFGRDKEGKSHRLDVTDFKPYFYIPSDQIERVNANLKLTEDEYKSIRGEPLRRVYTKTPGDIYEERDAFTHYEADVNFNNRFLIDMKIKSGVSFENSPCTYLSLKPIDLNYEARTMIVDIECSDERGFPDASKDPIICITCYDSFEKKYTSFLLTDKIINCAPKENGCFNPDVHDIVCYKTERDLLEGLSDYIRYIDPDILTGWNFNGFDMPYILGRMDVFGISRESIARLQGNSSRVEIRGRQIFDLLAGYKRMHLGEQPSYRLDAIAAAELGKQKIHFNGRICDLWRNNPEELLFYNFTDVELCVGIDAKDKTVEFHRKISHYVGCQLEKTTNSMPIIDIYILRKAYGRYILPSKSKIVEQTEKFKGATVFAPPKGIHENVAILDLTSLYPMIMMTINASPETKDPNGELKAPNGVRFKKFPDGLVREIQSEWFRERNETKAARNKFPFGSPEYINLDMQQNVMKIMMNSYYGVSGSNAFRLFDREIGDAVTSVGREILEHNRKIIEAEGYPVVMGDSVGKNSKVMFYNGSGEFKFYGNISDAFDDCAKFGCYKGNGGKEYCIPNDLYTETINENGMVVLKQVKYLMRHDCGKKMYRVNLTNSWFVDVTEDHSLIGLKKRRGSLGSRLVEVKPQDVGKDIKSLIVKKTSIRASEINNGFPKEAYELLGYFIGCGSFETNARRLSLAGGEDYKEILEKIFVPLEQKGWILKWDIKNEDKGDIRFSGRVEELIKTTIKEGTIGKHIPLFIYNESFENQCSFLRGLFSSDGTCMVRPSGPIVRYCSIHQSLCKEIQSLLHIVGISSSVYKDNTVNNYNGVVSGTFSYLVGIKSLERFSKSIGFIKDRKQFRISTYVATKKKNLESVDFDISGVKSVKEIKYNGCVYDIEVDGIHNFFANNILVHNTDSCGAKIPKERGREETMLIGKRIEKLLNESYTQFAKDTLNADVQFFSVKFEKLYERYFSGGKKKRYAGLLVWKEGKDVNEVDIVGFETERSDTPMLTRNTMRKLFASILEGIEYGEIKKDISGVIRNYRKMKYPLEDIGIPGGIGKALENYENPSSQVRGAMYSNKYLKTNFGGGSKPKRLLIKAVPSGYERTDVICFEYPEQVPKGFVIDTEEMLNKTLKAPISRVFDALGWDWNDFDPTMTNLSQWGLG